MLRLASSPLKPIRSINGQIVSARVFLLHEFLVHHTDTAGFPASITIPAVNPSTQLQIGVFAPDIVWAQSLSDNRLRGYTMDWAAEDTTFASGVDPIVLPPMSVNNASQVPLNGTHLAVTVIPGGRVIVFDQVTGADITVRTQKTAGTLASSGDAGAWDMGTVPIPQA